MFTYHIFTHNRDEYTTSFVEAERIYEQFLAEYGTARLYEEERDDDGEVIAENCLKSRGEWPM